MVRFLASAGVACESTPRDSKPLRLISFEKEDPHLLELVAACSEDGQKRVLVIATHKSSLLGGVPWKLLQAGASDVCAWDGMECPAECIGARLRRWREIEDLIDSPLVRENLVGRSKMWLSTLRQIVEVAHFTDASVLITGESGTGKELISRLIHTLDNRPTKKEMVVLDCTTIVPELSGSEFFGHERGSFTHAVAARDGAFALAQDGTLFLDEVGELPLSLQAELLRIVQERTYKRVGGNTWKKVEFRLVCATNRNLQQEKERGSFRLDFYHRIASWTCKLPSLNDRREDILPLAQHFLSHAGAEINELDSAVRDYLMLRNYPGNIRDLKQIVVRMARKHVGRGPITVGDIPEDENPFAAGMAAGEWKNKDFESGIRRALSLGVTLKEIGQAAADVAVQVALEDAQGNLQDAAQRLGVTDRALQMRRATQRKRDPADGTSVANANFPLDRDRESI
jgi:transcriptional regulator with GAF, ATPase, and Fis domain